MLNKATSVHWKLERMTQQRPVLLDGANEAHILTLIAHTPAQNLTSHDQAPRFPVRRALISVSDKTKLAEFAKGLELLGIEIVSTGGTATHFRDQGIPVLPVSEVTGFPEILEGRVKTLHPSIHGGILANLDHSATRDTLSAHKISPIGLVVVNLYPFEEAVKKNAADVEAMIEEIDIGGSALLRASAKNHAHVRWFDDPGDYTPCLKSFHAKRHDKAFDTPAACGQGLRADGLLQLGHRKVVFHRCGRDHAVLDVPHRQTRAVLALWRESAPAGRALRDSRQSRGPSLVRAEQVQGKELSYNNLTDADAAFELISEFPAASQPSPSSSTQILAASRPGQRVGRIPEGFACDPLSAFGGIVASNEPLDGAAAAEILRSFHRGGHCPVSEAEAKKAFAGKPNVRLLLPAAFSTRAKRAP